MTDLDRSLRWVRVSLVFFGVPLVGSLVALGLGPALAQVFPIQPAVLELIAAISAIAALVTMLIGWTADRRALRSQERELTEQAHELALKRQELEAGQVQHALQLSLKEQELEKEIALREEYVKVLELEHALAMRGADSESAEREQAGVTSPPSRVRRESPTALTRERRILIEPDSAGAALANDTTLTDNSGQELAGVPDVAK